LVVLKKFRITNWNLKIMTNNDIFKKLRVALQLRDDQIEEILMLVDFRMSKGEIGNFFRNADHPKYVECGDQVLRNFLNGLVIHLRGTKENPTNAMDVIKKNQAEVKKNIAAKAKPETKPKVEVKSKPANKPKPKPKTPKVQVVEKFQYKSGKNKK